MIIPTVFIYTVYYQQRYIHVLYKYMYSMQCLGFDHTRFIVIQCTCTWWRKWLHYSCCFMEAPPSGCVSWQTCVRAECIAYMLLKVLRRAENPKAPQRPPSCELLHTRRTPCCSHPLALLMMHVQCLQQDSYHLVKGGQHALSLHSAWARGTCMISELHVTG